MTRQKSPMDAELIEQDLERLVHAAQASDDLEVPEISDAELSEVTTLTDALARLRDAERDLSHASRTSLQLTAQDLRALQFLVVSLRRGDIVTPSTLASHLGISAASTTKLLNRLERGRHISRLLHPHDRRAIKIVVSPRTEALTQRSVGRQQARRFAVAASLTSAERAVVARFLDDLTDGIERDIASWTREGSD